MELDREKLRAEAVRLYCEEGLSLRLVGKRLGVHSATVADWLRKEGVKTRSLSEATKLGIAKGRVKPGPAPGRRRRAAGKPHCSRCTILLDEPSEDGLCADCRWEIAHPGQFLRFLSNDG